MVFEDFMDLDLIEKTIRRIDDDLVRLQYSLAIHKLTRTGDARVKNEIVRKLRTQNSRVAFNHIDLVLQQDCALAICRMMDLGTGTHSFWGLKNQCHPNRDFLIGNAESQYLNSDDNYLAQRLVNDMKGWIDEFVSKVSNFAKSKEFEAIKNLRNDTLGHALIDRKKRRPTIKMIENALPKLEDILRLSYLVFLVTDYRPQTAYRYAVKDADSFWSDFLKS